MQSLLLLHSPLLGPSSWTPVADEYRGAGGDAVVADLSDAFDRPSGWARAVAAAAVAASPDRGEVVVVGHSGIGYYMPIVGRAIGFDRVSFVFVDAVLPPSSGEVVPAGGVAELLDENTVDGWLAPWLDWWSTDLIDQILPEAADRTALRSDMPSVRRAVYDEAVPVPAAWRSRPVTYVQTSPAYEPEESAAGSLGWRCTELEGGTHLSIVTHPAETLSLILGEHRPT